MTALRIIEGRRTLVHRRMTPSFASYSVRSEPGFSLDPFLNLDEFVMSQATFPPHPHAGFSAVTYMFEDSQGSFLNRDSLGDSSRIEPGAVHWTQAARGMMHEEVPERPGVPCHGLQMFVNLADVHKRAAPAAYHASPAEVPEVLAAAGVRVRVLAGSFRDIVSPLLELLTPLTFLELHLAPGATVDVSAPRGHTAFAMTIRGEGLASGAPIGEHEAVTFTRDGDHVRFEGGPRGLQLLFGEGAPIGEPVVFGGPFAMTRVEDLDDARARFARGEMGRLS